MHGHIQSTKLGMVLTLPRYNYDITAQCIGRAEMNKYKYAALSCTENTNSTTIKN